MRSLILSIFLLYSAFSWGSGASIEKAYKEWVVFVDSNLWHVKKYEPRVYNKILSNIKDDLINREKKSDLLWHMRFEIQKLEQKYIASAPQDTLDEYLKIGIKQINFFLEKNDSTCIGLVTEGPAMIKAFKALPKEMHKNDILPRAMVNYHENKYKIPNEAEVLPILERIFKKLEEVYKKDFDIAFDDPNDKRVLPIKACKIYRDFFIELNLLDRNDREKTLRFMYSP
jgi:hypothetical protein